jgi:hypothetical protein
MQGSGKAGHGRGSESGVAANVEKVSDIKENHELRRVFQPRPWSSTARSNSVGKVPSKKEFLAWLGKA